ncbi:MAG: thiamine phosphate synthase [Acidobacteriia bacterium]|nr:thiamine phosphate synthase [Terriglobia bacterium]
MPGKLQLYYITDRTQIKSSSLEACIERAIEAGVDWVQIREKDLPARSLLTITQAAAGYARQRHQGRTRVMVNDRLDVALAATAHGVHLGTRSMPAGAVRRVVPREFLIGVSCHSLKEALAAQAAGADYLLLGPVFETPSKLPYGPPLGIARLREVTAQVKVPVFALGGMTAERVGICLENGAAGIAGIRIFQDCASVQELVRDLHARAEEQKS